MARKMLRCSIPFAGILVLGILISDSHAASAFEDMEPGHKPAELALVRVTIRTRTPQAADAVKINGKAIDPVLIQVFSSTGVVLDKRGDIMTFLGYRWVDVQGKDPSIQITTSEGQKWKGRLIGIDQHNGVAVVRPLGAQLKQTPICSDCRVKDGAIVRTPIVAGHGIPQLHEAQVVSVNADQEDPDQGKWALTVNKPFPDIGEPILDSEYRVLGFVVNQDPENSQTIVYPIADLLSSADKIIQKGGDIQVGWLGLFINNSADAKAPGVQVESVGPNSPAQKAGIAAKDIIVGFSGQRIENALQLIRLVEGAPIKSRVKLDILRNGKPLELSAIIEAHQSQRAPRKLAFEVPETLIPPAPKPVVGLDAVMLNSYLAGELKATEGGLLVIGVKEKSPADLAGVLAGDIIVAMDGKPIKDALSFSSYLQTLSWGASLNLKLLRKGSEQTIIVTLPNQ
jgi:serine protease Do